MLIFRADLCKGQYHLFLVKKVSLITILSSFLFIPTLNPAYGSILFAQDQLTENGVEWCEEVFPLYEQLGLQWFLENNHYSIEARVCANLIEDPLWDYDGPERNEKLVERSAYLAKLEYAESEVEAETGVDDPTPAEVPDEEIMEASQPDSDDEQIQDLEFTQTVAQESEGGCLIATAAFGSELSPQVQLLREVRENVLLKTQYGTMFLSGFNQFYYLFSPTIADWERENPSFKELVRITITPLLTTLSILNNVEVDSEASMLGYGIGMISLNVGMYFVFPALIAIKLKRRYAA